MGGVVHQVGKLRGGGNTALIEVQTDSYLGEDDIIRIEDDYRRRQRLPRGA
jgi:mannose-6-phosphate isomerase-like protein (cupin superfamily)